MLFITTGPNKQYRNNGSLLPLFLLLLRPLVHLGRREDGALFFSSFLVMCLLLLPPLRSCPCISPPPTAASPPLNPQCLHDFPSLPHASLLLWPGEIKAPPPPPPPLKARENLGALPYYPPIYPAPTSNGGGGNSNGRSNSGRGDEAAEPQRLRAK